MKIKSRVAVAAGLAATAALTAVPVASAAPSSHSTTGTVFVQTDELSHNTIVTYTRTGSGALHQAGSYRTGGKGGALDGAQVDHLASQSSLVRSGDHLFAVNAGSNTITSFAIRGHRLVRQQEINSGGDFPVSIAVSHGLLYVLNARGGGSIQGYLDLGGHLIKVPSWHRELGFDPNATPEFTSTPAQIAFSPNNHDLVITTKGDGSSIETFALGPLGSPADTPVITELPGQVPFGFDFDRWGHLVASEAGTNSVATFRLRSDGRAAQRDQLATGQQATCWVAVSKSGRVAYVSNAGSATITSYRISRSGTLSPLQTVHTNPGTVDAAVSSDGRNLYVQTGAQGTVDGFRIDHDGLLTSIGSVTVPGAVGGEGIVAR